MENQNCELICVNRQFVITLKNVNTDECDYYGQQVSK